MTILNGLGITSYSRTQPIGREGDLYTSPQQVRPMVNPLLAQISNVAIGTFDTDTDSITITVTEPDGTVHTQTVTRAAGAPANAAAAATAFEEAFNESSGPRGVFTAEATDDDLVLTFEHEGIDYVVEATPSAGTTATVTTLQAAGGAGVPFGRFVTSGGAAPDGGAILELPDATTDPIVGILAKAHAYINQGGALSTDVDALQPGEIGPVVREGEVLMRNVGSAAAVPYGAVYAVVDTDGGNELGEASTGVDGAAQVSTIVPVVNHQFYAFSLGIAGRTFLAQYNATDATTAVADAIDGLFDAIVEQIGGDTPAENGLGLTITESDTELTITTDAGVVLDHLLNAQWNLDTEVATSVATVGTPGAANVLVEGAYWAEAVAAGAVGPVHVRL